MHRRRLTYGSDLGLPLRWPISRAGLCPTCLLAEGLDLDATEASGGESYRQAGSVEGIPENDVFGPYRILRLLGKGGMGSV